MASIVIAIFGIIESWVFLSSLVLTIISTILFILDVENEMATRAAKQVGGSEEEIILNFGGLDD